MNNKFIKAVAGLVTVAVVFTQVFGVYSVVTPAKPANAAITSLADNLTSALGSTSELTSVPTVDRFSWMDFFQGMFEDAMMGLAYSFAQFWMQRFVDKVTEKYKIKNFLYYDQILSNYYLTNFLRDKISDPDLREIYVLLESEFVLGQYTGTTPGSSTPGNPAFDKKKALVPRLKRAIANLYTSETGIDPNLVANLPPSFNTQEKLRYSRMYYMNPIGYTENRLRTQFGEYQSEATTAAQLEVIVGNGLKAGRWIGGWCRLEGRQDEPDEGDSSINTPEKCRARGGEWVQSALDEARSMIDNPTAFVDKWMGSTIEQLTDANFNPNNFWFVIGNAFGRFLTNRLFIDKAQGVLEEDPRGFNPVDPGFGAGVIKPNQLDIDGDGIVDGYDSNNDGVLDFCIFGGTPPDCAISSESGAEGNTGPPPPPDAYTRHPSRADLVASIVAELVAQGVSLIGECGAFEVTKRVAWELRNEGAGLFVKDPGQTQCNGYGIDVIIYNDGYVYDILGDAGGENRPQWLALAAVPLDRYAPPINPNPVCTSGPLRPLSLVLENIRETVSSWNFDVDRSSETGWSDQQVNTMLEEASDVMDDAAVDPYKSDLQNIISAILPFNVGSPLITGPFGAILNEGSHFLTQEEKDQMNSQKSLIVTLTSNLASRVVQSCN